jgi:hypothetical protein
MSFHDLDAAGRNDYSGPTRQFYRSSLDFRPREFSGVQLDEVVHADRLLACEFEQVIGHTVVAALLVQLSHHGEVLDDVRRHARPQKLFAPVILKQIISFRGRKFNGPMADPRRR